MDGGDTPEREQPPPEHGTPGLGPGGAANTARDVGGDAVMVGAAATVNVYNANAEPRPAPPPFAVHSPPPFVDREEPLRAALDRVAEGRDSVVHYTVFGDPGVGKTALARKLLHRLREERPERFTGGFFEVRPARDGLQESLGALLSWCAPSYHGPGDMPTTVEGKRRLLHRLLRTREPFALLVDDAQSLAQLHAFIPPVAGSALVVTGSRPLDPCPDPEEDAEDGDPFAHLDSDALRLGPLGLEDAVDLLERRANHALTDEHRELARELVRSADGSPGAVVKLARRIRQATWSDGEEPGIVVLHRELISATGEGGSVSEGETILGALSPRAAELCAALAWHPDAPFGAEVAAHLLGGDEEEARGALEELVSAGVVEAAEGRGGEDLPRFRFTDRRSIDALRSGPAGERDLLGAVLSHYLGLALAAHDVLLPGRWRHPVHRDDPLVSEPEMSFWRRKVRALGFWSWEKARVLDHLDNDREALRAAVASAAENDRPRTAFRLCEALWAYWFLCSDFDAIVASHTVLLERSAAPAVLLPGELSRMYVQRSIARRRGASTARVTGEDQSAQLEQARRDAERAVELAREEEPQRRQRALLTALEAVGDVHLDAGEPAQAVPYFAQALGIAEALDPPDRRAQYIEERKLAVALMRDGRIKEAESHLKHAWELLEWVQQVFADSTVPLVPPAYNEFFSTTRDGYFLPTDPQNTAQIRAAQAELAFLAGRLDEAQSWWSNAMEAHMHHGNRGRAADLLVQWADAIEAYDPKRARTKLEQALDLYRSVSAGLAADAVATRLQDKTRE
jgi:tetratricopeptide (TPR) repeat protein